MISACKQPEVFLVGGFYGSGALLGCKGSSSWVWSMGWGLGGPIKKNLVGLMGHQ